MSLAISPISAGVVSICIRTTSSQWYVATSNRRIHVIHFNTVVKVNLIAYGVIVHLLHKKLGEVQS